MTEESTMIETYITSYIDGRVRLRHPALRDEGKIALLRQLASSIPGILEISANPRTGSLLLEYDPEKMNRDSLLELAAPLEVFMQEDACGPERKKKVLPSLSKPQCKRFLNRTMLLALAGSAGFGLAGRAGAHIAASGLFLLCNLIHIYAYRKCL